MSQKKPNEKWTLHKEIKKNKEKKKKKEREIKRREMNIAWDIFVQIKRELL